MAEFISIEAKLNEAQEFLKEIDGNQNAMRRRVLSAVGTGARAAIKKSYGAYLNRRTGTLYKSIKKKMISKGKAVSISATARNDQKLYGYALAKGSTITAKNGQFLTFQIGDKWVKVHSVKLPEKNFIVEPSEKYLHSADAQSRIEKQLQKELDKAAQKATK